MTDKKDVLDFPLEEVEVPQAIALMMQAAAKCGAIIEEGDAEDEEKALERLQLLCEKLEARIQDEIDSLTAVRTEPTPEDAPNDPLEVDVASQIFASGTDADSSEFLNWEGRLFKKMCNERVHTDPDSGESTYCIKQWAHQGIEHEDMEGNIR